MKFYYVHEDNTYTEVGGDNYGIYQSVQQLIHNEKHNSGFIGAIDITGKLRGTLPMHNYRGQYQNKLFDFIRKYRSIEILENLSNKLKKEYSNE